MQYSVNIHVWMDMDGGYCPYEVQASGDLCLKFASMDEVIAFIRRAVHGTAEEEEVEDRLRDIRSEGMGIAQALWRREGV
jgi:hypothetical protein